MRKVITIDGISLDNACYSSAEFDIDDFLAERTVAIDGSSILFVQAKGAMSKDVQFTSKSNGWITSDTMDLLIASVDVNSIIVEYDDLSTETFYYDHTTTPLKFIPLYDGSLWYNVEINLLKG